MENDEIIEKLSFCNAGILNKLEKIEMFPLRDTSIDKLHLRRQCMVRKLLVKNSKNY